MKKVIKENQRFERIEVSREEAVQMIKDFGQERFKLGRLEDIPAGEAISFYRNGEFIDFVQVLTSTTPRRSKPLSCSRLLEHTIEAMRTNSFKEYMGQLFQQRMNYQITSTVGSEQKSEIIEKLVGRWACSKLTTRWAKDLFFGNQLAPHYDKNYRILSAKN